MSQLTNSRVTIPLDSIQAELLAIEEAIAIAKGMRIQSLQIFKDCKKATTIIDQATMYHDRFSIVQDCREHQPHFSQG